MWDINIYIYIYIYMEFRIKNEINIWTEKGLFFSYGDKG